MNGKDFDKWNKVQKSINEREITGAYPREVWWCSIGLNIGAETDGKNENFERPVLVIRVYNKDTMLVLPITSREKKDKFHFEIAGKSGKVWVKLTQARVISSRRLLRKVDMISENDFKSVKKMLRKFI